MSRLDSLTREYLTALAKTATGHDTFAVNSWAYEPVQGGFGGAIGGTAIYRFTLESAAAPPCSLILKILYQRPNEGEQSPYYWKREYEVYRAGILLDLPDDCFVTPRIFGTEDFGEYCWIWMEDVYDLKQAWNLADYHEIARRMGRFNGAWLAGRALPQHNWLARNWHSAIVPALADTFDQLDRLLEYPLARDTLPMESREEIETIWRERDAYRDALTQLPQTFCHNDAFRRNVLHRTDDIVLLDWALAGCGAIGEDLVSLVAVSLYYDGFSPDHGARTDAAVFTGYIKGLREAGWDGEERLARIGYTCGMAMRGLAGVKQDINQLLDQSKHSELTQIHRGKPVVDIAKMFAAVRQFRLLKMAREARDLLSL